MPSTRESHSLTTGAGNPVFVSSAPATRAAAGTAAEVPAGAGKSRFARLAAGKRGLGVYGSSFLSGSRIASAQIP